MATAQPIASSSARRKRRRLWLIPVVILGGAVAWFWHPLHSYAVTGASYGARVGCSCRFVEGRALGDCRKDFEAGMALVRLSEDETAKSVTASFPLLSRQTATFREGEGCVLERWEN
ncbi:hypothetical protein KRR38_20765 [Novosphingobium sp. G106]|nr:hypothetical protein [Novosphingobium sp. G106]